MLLMRLSFKKGAHAALPRAACRKFGVSRSFFARCGRPQISSFLSPWEPKAGDCGHLLLGEGKVPKSFISTEHPSPSPRMHLTNLQGDSSMAFGRSFALTAILVLNLSPAFAQTPDPGPKQDMKNAGTETKHAATSAGHGISHGTQTAYTRRLREPRRATTKPSQEPRPGTTKRCREPRPGTTRPPTRPRPESTRSRASRTPQQQPPAIDYFSPPPVLRFLAPIASDAAARCGCSPAPSPAPASFSTPAAE